MAVTDNLKPGQKPASGAPAPGPVKAPAPMQEVSLAKEQIAILEETRKLVMWKMSILQKLDTIPLIEQIHGLEQTISNIMQEEATFKGENRGFIAGTNEDCTSVKIRLAELWTQSDGMLNSDGSKKATQADREAWLRKQRIEDKDLAGLILKQVQVQTGLDGFKIELDTAKRKLDGVLAVLRLKTAQIEFLGRSV